MSQYLSSGDSCFVSVIVGKEIHNLCIVVTYYKKGGSKESTLQV